MTEAPLYMNRWFLHKIEVNYSCCMVLCAFCSMTGHYELNLALPVHAAIAARLRDDSQSCPDGPTWINLLHDMAT